MAPLITTNNTENEEKKRLPITLISGFLGSGKTTLLEHILRSKDHGLRCAVIVNDMAALNIDADLINSRQVVQKQEKVVQLQNGCICCTLREDLLEEVVELAEKQAFDYLVIESTGISEPQQVCETFTSEFLDEVIQQHGEEDSNEEMEELAPVFQKLKASGGISRIARLDTCVTVIDCVNFFATFETTDMLIDRYGSEVEESDERTIVDLMVDQIEFANVILLNKTDLVSPAQLEKIEDITKKLNPVAKVIRTEYSRVDLGEIINTNLFDFEKAATSAGWLQSLNEMSMQANGKLAPKPETLEYGIGNFIYRARRPFHPARLSEAINQKFLVICHLNTPEEEEEAEGEEEEMQEEEEEAEDEMEEDAVTPEAIEMKKQCPVFGPMLRSKGFLWLATCPDHYAEWSQAGCVISLGMGPKWFCETDESEWPEESTESIRADFENGSDWKWGDRRQELVIIGCGLDNEATTKLLDSCLLTDTEWSDWQNIMTEQETRSEKLLEMFEDPFGLSYGSADEGEEYEEMDYSEEEDEQAER